MSLWEGRTSSTIDVRLPIQRSVTALAWAILSKSVFLVFDAVIRQWAFTPLLLATADIPM